MKIDTCGAGNSSPVIRHSSLPADSSWVAVCRLEDIVPNTGVCALVHGRQVAVFRLDDDSVHAIDNHDPFSQTNVLSRGIVGDLKGELVVASPVYKQHFSLVTGRCIEDETVSVPIYGTSIQGKHVMVQKSTAHNAAHNGRN
jgi:NAD(P)H-dependent nitrite reductase small subunit